MIIDRKKGASILYKRPRYITSGQSQNVVKVFLNQEKRLTIRVNKYPNDVDI